MSLTFTQQKKPASSLIPARKGHQDHQTAFQPPKAAEAPLQPGFGHEFGQVDAHSGGRTGQQFASSCTLALPSPRACPFGGACHSCPAPVQAKLTISQPGNKYEQEADRVADAVMSLPEPRNGQRLQRECSECVDEVNRQEEKPEDEEKEEEEPEGTASPKLLQRQDAEEKEEEEEKTASAKSQPGHTPQVTPAVTANINALRGRGQPLPGTSRAFFEPRFGHDFSRVQVHTDARATDTAQTVRARAFTVGRDIVFGDGQYAPDTQGGRRLLAHELTHVVQQEEVPREIIRAKTTSSKRIFLWTIYKRFGKDYRQIPHSEIKKTIEYKDYVKLWKMDDQTALYACMRVFQRFIKGIFGRKENFIASGRDAKKAKVEKGGAPTIQRKKQPTRADLKTLFSDLRLRIVQLQTKVQQVPRLRFSDRLWAKLKRSAEKLIEVAPFAASYIKASVMDLLSGAGVIFGHSAIVLPAILVGILAALGPAILAALKALALLLLAAGLAYLIYLLIKAIVDAITKAIEALRRQPPILWSISLPWPGPIGMPMVRTKPPNPRLPGGGQAVVRAGIHAMGFSSTFVAHHILPLCLGGMDILPNVTAWPRGVHITGHASLRIQPHMALLGHPPNIYAHPPPVGYFLAGVKSP